MLNNTRALVALLSIVLALCSATMAHATTIQELVRLRGQEAVEIQGMGIVVGLNGTGDESKKSLLTARPVAEMIRNLGYPLPDITELAAGDSYALVLVTMTIPALGAPDGERIDVTVSTLYNAKSLQGGELVVTPLRLPLPDSPDLVPLAFARGSIILESDNPRVGRVRSGGQMLQTVDSHVIANDGSITMVVREQFAGPTVVSMLANEINDEFQSDARDPLARVLTARSIRVRIPKANQANPYEFIAALLGMHIEPSLIQTEARIVINEKQGIITLTGDVQIGPVGVRANNISVTTVTPEPVPDPQNPVTTTRRSALLDTTGGASRNATHLSDLLDALEQLNVPVADQIAIIHAIQDTGKLFGRIVYE